MRQIVFYFKREAGRDARFFNAGKWVFLFLYLEFRKKGFTFIFMKKKEVLASIKINKDVLREVKAHLAREDRSIKEFVENAIKGQISVEIVLRKEI